MPQVPHSPVPVAKVPQQPAASPKENWHERLASFEAQVDAPSLFITNDETEKKKVAKGLVDLLHVPKPGNKDVEQYLKELDRQQLINLLGSLTATLSCFG